MARVVTKTAVAAARGAQVDYARLDAQSDTDIERQTIEDDEDSNANDAHWHPSPLQLRQKLHLTQQGIADLLGVPVATWRNWEQGRTIIDAPGRALLTILQREPAAVLRAMQRQVA